MTSPAAMCLSCLDDVVAEHALTLDREVLLTSPMQPHVGALRVWRGTAGVAKAVYAGITVDAIGLDSHMLFAFTDADSAVPHFTLDSVMAGGALAFHLDLIPRADLGSELAYMDHCYTPLTEDFDRFQAADGLSRAEISPRQRAVMSPWMYSHRATPDAFAQLSAAVQRYRQHWSRLVHDGVPVPVSSLVERDRRNRAALFNPDVDPVWNQIQRLLGDQAEQIRVELLNND